LVSQRRDQRIAARTGRAPQKKVAKELPAAPGNYRR